MHVKSLYCPSYIYGIFFHFTFTMTLRNRYDCFIILYQEPNFTDFGEFYPRFKTVSHCFTQLSVFVFQELRGRDVVESGP